MTTRRTLGVLVTVAVIIMFLTGCALNNNNNPNPNKEAAVVFVDNQVAHQVVIVEW